MAVTGEGERSRYIGPLCRDRKTADQRRHQSPSQCAEAGYSRLARSGEQEVRPHGKRDADEERARTEKAVALDRLAGSRMGVLIGPAGTGKTTVIQLLLSRTDIVGARVRLLAPTGKARVRLGQETGRTAASRPSRNSCSVPASMLIPAGITQTLKRRRRKRRRALSMSRRC